MEQVFMKNSPKRFSRVNRYLARDGELPVKKKETDAAFTSM
jgi:hypothetical protein